MATPTLTNGKFRSMLGELLPEDGKIVAARHRRHLKAISVSSYNIGTLGADGAGTP